MDYVDLVVYGLLVLGFLLLSLLPPWLKHRRQGDGAAGVEPIPRAEAGLDAQWGRDPRRDPRRVSPDAGKHAPRTSAEHAARPRAGQGPRLRGAKDLRDAIVLTAILGPCRAKEPYGSKEP